MGISAKLYCARSEALITWNDIHSGDVDETSCREREDVLCDGLQLTARNEGNDGPQYGAQSCPQLNEHRLVLADDLSHTHCPPVTGLHQNGVVSQLVRYLVEEDGNRCAPTDLSPHQRKDHDESNRWVDEEGSPNRHPISEVVGSISDHV